MFVAASYGFASSQIRFIRNSGCVVTPLVMLRSARKGETHAAREPDFALRGISSQPRHPGACQWGQDSGRRPGVVGCCADDARRGHGASGHLAGRIADSRGRGPARTIRPQRSGPRKTEERDSTPCRALCYAAVDPAARPCSGELRDRRGARGYRDRGHGGAVLPAVVRAGIPVEQCSCAAAGDGQHHGDGDAPDWNATKPFHSRCRARRAYWRAARRFR